MDLFSRPSRSLAAGTIAALLAMSLWLMEGHRDLLGLASFVLRFAHIASAMVWVGLIWFVNFIQLEALRAADDADRAALFRTIVPQVAQSFRVASHVVVASGACLLLASGYLLDRWVFPSAVYIPSMRAGMMWGGALAGLVMWALVHGVIWPNLKTVLDTEARAAAKSAARHRILIAARVNLVLAIPVTYAMVAAAHLY